MEIFTGYLLYEQLQELLLGDHEQRRQVKEFERFLSKNFFQSQDVVLIPKLQPNNKEAKDVFVKVGKEAERPIHQLGDGLQQIILITFPVFRDKKKDLLVFVEEPELFMHPGMQRALLEVFASSEFGHSQFFINTHSNHLLDLSLDIEDIAIYHLRKDRTEETDESIKNIYRVKQLNEEDRSLLNDLGVRNSSVFLTNATIWVEGITDRKYIRKYLALYQNHKLSLDSSFKLIKEDTHYSFVEYGGANITHWSFLSENEEEEAINIDKLCSSAFVVMDRDSGTYKQVRATKIEKKLGKNFHLTKGKEIENAISSNIIVKVVSNWEKIQPGAVNNNFETDDYRESGLGAFIEDVILKDAAKKKRKYVKRKEDGSIDGSGTILPKGKFCDAATEETKQFSDLSNESVELCEKLYNFVQSMNK